MKLVEMQDKHERALTAFFDTPHIRVFERPSETPFVTQRRLISLYLRSIWGREFNLDTLPHTRTGKIANGVLYFPNVVSSQNESDNKALYRAMAAHMAAHLVYGQRMPHCISHGISQDGDTLDPVLNALIEWVEDARVEQSAMHFFPGIEKQWEGFLPTRMNAYPADSVERLLLSIQCAMFNKNYTVDDAALAGWVSRFHQVIIFNRYNESVSIVLARELYALLTARSAAMDVHMLNSMQFPYRDAGSV